MKMTKVFKKLNDGDFQDDQWGNLENCTHEFTKEIIFKTWLGTIHRWQNKQCIKCGCKK
jgi:hypothetical protein